MSQISKAVGCMFLLYLICSIALIYIYCFLLVESLMGIESNKLLNPDDPYLEASGKYVSFYYITVELFNHLNFINERRWEKN